MKCPLTRQLAAAANKKREEMRREKKSCHLDMYEHALTRKYSRSIGVHLQLNHHHVGFLGLVFVRSDVFIHTCTLSELNKQHRILV